MNLKETFKIVDTVLVIDWPTKDVPETLTRAGLRVVVRGGPGPEDYSVYELNNGDESAAPGARMGPSWPLITPMTTASASIERGALVLMLSVVVTALMLAPARARRSRVTQGLAQGETPW